MLHHVMVYVCAACLSLAPGRDENSPKPVFDVFRVAYTSVVRIGALEAMGVYAVDSGYHQHLSAFDGFQIVPKRCGDSIGLCEAKSNRPLIP